MEVNQDSQTLNSTLPATETGEIGGLVGSDRPINADDTLNTSTIDTGDDAGTPSGADDKGAASDDKGDLKDGEDKTGEADKGGKADDGDDTRFDKHPRFQQVMKERDEERRTRERLEAQMEILTKVVEPPPKPDKGEEKLPYKDTSTMPEDELAQWQANDPKGYEANLAAKIKHELLKDLNQNAETHSRQSAVEKTYETFAEKNADFNDRWKTGEIKQYIDTHPGHNPMSAYHEMIAESREQAFQARLDEAVTKAKADTEKEVLARIKAKQKAHVLDDGPAANIHVPGNDDPGNLTTNKSQGGVKGALTNLLHSMRQNAGGA